MRAQEFVTEAFDQPYKGKWEKSEYGDVDLNTKLPDGTNLSIMFNNQQDDEGQKVVQVEFYRNNSQEVTGEGDAQRIFATVLNAIQKYIKKYKPSKLSFSASKATDPTIYYEPDQPQPNPESRAKLYDRLVQRYAKAWGYRAFRADNGDLVIYELSRLKQGVAEGAVEDLEKDLDNPKSYSAIDHMMQTIARDYGITGKQLHDEFVKKHGTIPDKWTREQLRELSFLGSQCTKDCSGHRAGYAWSQKRSGRQPASWSDSFNRGAALFAAGK